MVSLLLQTETTTLIRCAGRERHSERIDRPVMIRVGTELNGNWFPWAATNGVCPARQLLMRMAQRMFTTSMLSIEVAWRTISSTLRADLYRLLTSPENRN